jgi:hydroxypyruvate isomerase
MATMMDGDIVGNIRDDFQWIGHFHTGGNPGRRDIDESQELNYRFIAQSIAALNCTGFISPNIPLRRSRPYRHAQKSHRDPRGMHERAKPFRWRKREGKGSHAIKR